MNSRPNKKLGAEHLQDILRWEGCNLICAFQNLVSLISANWHLLELGLTFFAPGHRVHQIQALLRSRRMHSSLADLECVRLMSCTTMQCNAIHENSIKVIRWDNKQTMCVWFWFESGLFSQNASREMYLDRFVYTAQVLGMQFTQMTSFQSAGVPRVQFDTLTLSAGHGWPLLWWSDPGGRFWFLDSRTARYSTVSDYQTEKPKHVKLWDCDCFCWDPLRNKMAKRPPSMTGRPIWRPLVCRPGTGPLDSQTTWEAFRYSLEKMPIRGRRQRFAKGREFIFSRQNRRARLLLCHVVVIIFRAVLVTSILFKNSSDFFLLNQNAKTFLFPNSQGRKGSKGGLVPLKNGTTLLSNCHRIPPRRRELQVHSCHSWVSRTFEFFANLKRRWGKIF